MSWHSKVFSHSTKIFSYTTKILFTQLKFFLLQLILSLTLLNKFCKTMKVFISMKYFLDFLIVKLSKIAIGASTKRTKINQN